MPDQHDPPSVAGVPTRAGEVLFPTWVRVIGGPAELLNEQDWTVVAYVDIEQGNVDAAEKLRQRSALAPGAEWRVESLGEESGYEKFRSKSGRLYVVKADPRPYLAAYTKFPPPSVVSDGQTLTDLIRLAEYASQVS